MIDKFFDIKSINPYFWGKSGWIFLNSIAITYKPEKKEHYKLFIEQLSHILPCKSCGENLKRNLPTLDSALVSKESFLNWLLNIRNEIYIENGEPEYKKNLKQTFDEIFYKNNNNYESYIWIVFLFLLLILLIFIFKKNINKL